MKQVEFDVHKEFYLRIKKSKQSYYAARADLYIKIYGSPEDQTSYYKRIWKSKEEQKEVELQLFEEFKSIHEPVKLKHELDIENIMLEFRQALFLKYCLNFLLIDHCDMLLKCIYDHAVEMSYYFHSDFYSDLEGIEINFAKSVELTKNVIKLTIVGEHDDI